MQRGAQENLCRSSSWSAPLRATSSVLLKAPGMPFRKPNKIQGSTSTGIVGFALGRERFTPPFELVFSMAKGLWKTISGGIFSILSVMSYVSKVFLEFLAFSL